jgi:hypothetical protein
MMPIKTLLVNSPGVCGPDWIESKVAEQHQRVWMLLSQDCTFAHALQNVVA